MCWVFPPRLKEQLHRKRLFRRTQYWKHSSVKELRNAAEPLKLNKYVALNCQTHTALIFKPFYPTKGPESHWGWEEGLPVRKSMPWSSSVSVCVSGTVCSFGTRENTGATPSQLNSKCFISISPSFNGKYLLALCFGSQLSHTSVKVCGTICTIFTAA